MEKKKHNLKERTVRGEKIGGGFFVMRRHRSTNRVHVPATGLPFEHPDLEAATAEAHRLAALHNRRFCVFQQVTAIDPPARAEPQGLAPLEGPTGPKPGYGATAKTE